MCYICNDVLSRLKLWISFACKDNIILYIANNNGVNKFLGCMVWHCVFLSVPSCLKKVCHLMFFNNWQMWNDFHNSFTSWFIKNSLCISHKIHLTCNMLLHYLVKVENPKMLLILTASSTNCWHVPEDTLSTWLNRLSQDSDCWQCVTNILKFVRQCLKSTADQLSIVASWWFFCHDYLCTVFVLFRLFFVCCTHI